MCILAIALGLSPSHPFILLFNRDEAFQRPTQPLSQWPGRNIIAGLDLLNLGTWLGVNTVGAFAALTNYWEDEATELEFNSAPSAPLDRPESSAYMTRGLIPVRLLETGANMPEVLSHLSSERYKSLNLLSGSIPDQRVYYTSVRQKYYLPPRELPFGVHCISNNDLDSDWDKVQRLKSALSQKIATDEVETEGLFALLRDETQGREIEGLNPVETAIFVRTYEDEHFGKRQPLGTVSSTVLIYREDGQMEVTERTFSPDQSQYTEAHVTISLPITP